LGNHSYESFFGNFTTQSSPFSVHSFTSQIEIFSQIGTSMCVKVVQEIVNKTVDKPLFWSLYFDGSKSNEDARS